MSQYIVVISESGIYIKPKDSIIETKAIQISYDRISDFVNENNELYYDAESNKAVEIIHGNKELQRFMWMPVMQTFTEGFSTAYILSSDAVEKMAHIKNEMIVKILGYVGNLYAVNGYSIVSANITGGKGEIADIQAVCNMENKRIIKCKTYYGNEGKKIVHIEHEQLIELINSMYKQGFLLVSVKRTLPQCWDAYWKAYIKADFVALPENNEKEAIDILEKWIMKRAKCSKKSIETLVEWRN